MINGAKKRLKAVFAAAAIGITGLVAVFTAGCGRQETAPEVPDTPATVMKKSTVSVWERILAKDTITFDANSKTSEPVTGSVSVQIESSMPSVQGLTLSPYFEPSDASTRHGHAASHLTNSTADAISGKDADIRFIERSDNITDWVFDPNNEVAQAIFMHADMITLSMGFSASGDQSRAYSVGTLDNEQAIADADKLWKNSDAIFFWSAGNDGRDLKVDMQRNHADLLSRADTMIKVGETVRDTSGRNLVVAHSSRSNPSVVTSNPYTEGVHYQYISSDEQFRKTLNTILDTPAGGYYGKTVREIIKERLIVRLYVGHVGLEQAFYPLGVTLPQYVAPAVVPPANLIPDFKKLEFKGKDILMKDALWQSQNADQVIEAFVEGMVAARPSICAYYGADINGDMTGMAGTSFSAPHLAGMTKGESLKHPEVSKYHLDAAVLLAADPIMYVLRASGNIDKVNYNNNGRNLPHNSYEAGFGFVSKDALAASVQSIADLQKQNPELSTKEVSIDTGMVKVERNVSDAAPSKAPKVAEYKFEVTDDMIALRTNIAIKFTKGAASAPVKLTLVNPAGGEIEISPTKIYGAGAGSAELSIATTDGHFGNLTKGTWTVRVTENAPIEAVRLTVHGFERGGLMDTYLQQTVDAQPYAAPVHNADTPKPEQPKPANSNSLNPPDKMIMNKRIVPNSPAPK